MFGDQDMKNSTQEVKLYQGKLSYLFPKILEINTVDLNNGSWKLYFYHELEGLFCDNNGALKKNILDQIKYFFNDEMGSYRIQVEFNTIPLLMAVFCESKEIRFYSCHLGTELFLLQEVSLDDLEDQKMAKRFILYKEHAEKCALLSCTNFPSVIEQITQINDLPDLLNDAKYKRIMPNVREKIKKIVFLLNSYRSGFFEKLTDYGLGLTADFALMRVHLLKFLAILPSLDHDYHGTEVKRILLEALRRLVTDSKRARFLGRKGSERPIPNWLENIFGFLFQFSVFQYGQYDSHVISDGSTIQIIFT